MMAYVDKSKLISHIESELIRWGESEYNALQILGDIEDFPTANVVEVKHGHWIKSGNEKKCSVCGFVYYSNNDEWNGCPNCLAKMDGEVHNDGKDS